MQIYRLALAGLPAAFVASCIGPIVPDSWIINYYHDRCAAGCPAYALTIWSNGDVLYQGMEGVAVKGSRQYTVPANEAIELFRHFRAAHLWWMRDEYNGHNPDAPRNRIGICMAGQCKDVLDWDGLNAGMPQIVRDLENEIDRVARTAPLVYGDKTRTSQ